MSSCAIRGSRTMGVELDNMVVKDSVGLNSDVMHLSFTTGYRP